MFMFIPLSSIAQEREFVFWVNEKRAARLAPKLTYEPKHQGHLTDIAKAMSKKYCHCYSGAYLGEVMTKSMSLEACFESLMLSDSHRKIMMSRKARRATVGVYQNGGWWNVVMRVYGKR